METVKFLTAAELEAGVGEVRKSPKDNGEVRMIVRRPRPNEREVLTEARIDMNLGLVGDCWRERTIAKMPGELPNPELQLTIVNARAIELIAGSRERWSLAGDQLYIDLDLSTGNLPPGTKLSIGTSVVEISDKPHNGCKKYTERFGLEAMKYVNSPVGKELHLRGIYARVVKPGLVRNGDKAIKITT